ncbi:MAG: GNAT family N-acetyltransferase [Candidatus Hermodarchaeota archaeon]
MNISIHKWDEVDIHQIAQLTLAAKRDSGRWGAEETIERAMKNLYTLKTSYRKLFGVKSPIVFLARSDGKLIGYLILFFKNHKKVEINPWFLDGHPLVFPNKNGKEIGTKLISEVVKWTKKEGIETIELTIPWKLEENNRIYDEYEAWYGSHGFELKLKYVFMTCNLVKHAITDVMIPSGFEIKQIRAVSKNALYQCYYDAFKTGDAQFFFYQTEKERREFFNKLTSSDALNDVNSLVLMKDQQLIGFVYTIPYGEKKRNISCMCIHPDFWGRKLGKFLLLLVMKRAALQGHRIMTLGTEPDMRAFQLYRKNGFKVTSGEITYIWKNASKYVLAL